MTSFLVEGEFVIFSAIIIVLASFILRRIRSGSAACEKGEPAARNVAVVVGASFAGLAHARALSDHFKSVIILERDQIDSSVSHRRGVPQDHQIHGMLKAGCNQLNKWFPDYEKDLLKAGAVVMSGPEDTAFYQDGWGPRMAVSGLDISFCSRPLREKVLRDHVLRVPNIKIMDKCTVANYLTNEEGNTITGVKYRSGSAVEETDLLADLVVDCGGKHSRASIFLADLGFPKAEAEAVVCHINYTSHVFTNVKVTIDGDPRLVAKRPKFPDTKFASIWKMEDNTYGFLCGCIGGPTPKDLAEMLSWPPILEQSCMLDMLKDATPVGKPEKYCADGDRWVHYDETNLPAGLLVSGDALAYFNPTYGQGMSLGVLEAAQLDSILAIKTLSAKALQQQFYKKSEPIIKQAFRSASYLDLRQPSATGKRPWFLKYYLQFLGVVAKTGASDRWSYGILNQCHHMVKPSYYLFHPRFLWNMALVLSGFSQPRVYSSPPPKERVSS